MKIELSRGFEKEVQNLKPAQKKRLQQALQLFMNEPYDPTLYNHALTGEWDGFRSIAFGGDWRAHYKIVDSTAIFIKCGTHSQLYK